MKGALGLALATLVLYAGSPARAAPDAPPAPPAHAITIRVALALDADGQHVTLKTQNGATVSLAKQDLVGKPVLLATARGGEPITNARPIDAVTVTLGPDLTASYTTPARYGDGAWEVACVISLSGSQRVPAAGDLAAFDNSPPPAGEDPPTGVSVRVHVRGGDTRVTLANRHFIRFAG
jgi:hypothetical protein